MKNRLICCVCSQECERTSNRQKYCPECSVNVEKQKCVERYRDAYVPKPKDVPCKECGVTIYKTARCQRFCEECARKRRLSLKRSRSAKQREWLGQIRIGTTIKCRVCQTEFTKDSPHREYCIGCEKRETERLLTKRVSSLIRHGLKNNKNGLAWKSLVDFSLNDLFIHLERQFLPNMSWENMDEWHIDHIVPRCSFQYTTPEDDEFKACWALTNLRPLWGEDNQEKGGKFVFLI